MLSVELGALDYIIQETSGNLCMVYVVIRGGIFCPRSTLTCKSRQGDTEDNNIDGSITDSSSEDKRIIGYFVLILSTYIYSR
jgi:hypothetical protein